MAASYPDGVKTWTPRTDGVDDVMAADINSIYEEVTALETYAIPNDGDASDVTAAFTQASTRANLTSGEKLKISLGKLMKWFADLKTVAFSGSYSDLSDEPTIPSNLSDLQDDSTHRFVTDTEKSTWNGKQAALGFTPVPDTRKVNSKALSSDITLSASDVGALASSAEGTGYVGIDTNNAGKIKPERATAALRSHSSSLTLDLAHAGTALKMTNSTSVTVTIPPNSGVAFPVETELEIIRLGSGAVTVAAGSGVTILCATSARTIAAQYTRGVLKKIDTNTWLLEGSIG